MVQNVVDFGQRLVEVLKVNFEIAAECYQVNMLLHVSKRSVNSSSV